MDEELQKKLASRFVLYRMIEGDEQVPTLNGFKFDEAFDNVEVINFPVLCADLSAYIHEGAEACLRKHTLDYFETF